MVSHLITEKQLDLSTMQTFDFLTGQQVAGKIVMLGALTMPGEARTIESPNPF
jgi:hypothetical protein